jgi:hypothetical protein
VRENFIFIHIFKTAGGTFRRIIDELYGDKCARIGANKPTTVFKGRRLKKLGKYPVITGHVKYDEVKDCGYDLITVIRNPVERMISFYFYYKKHRIIESGMTIADVAEQYPNQQSEFIGDLSKYSFIGLQEKFDETLDRFSIWCGCEEIPKYRNYNVNKSKKEVTEKERKIITEFNKEDLKIWQEVVDKW